MANLQSASAISNGPTMSTETFSQATAGRGTGWSGASWVAVDLSQFFISISVWDSILGHHYSSLRHCFVRTMPWWVSWPMSMSFFCNDSGTSKPWVPLTIQSSITASSWQIKKYGGKSGSSFLRASLSVSVHRVLWTQDRHGTQTRSLSQKQHLDQSVWL